MTGAELWRRRGRTTKGGGGEVGGSSLFRAGGGERASPQSLPCTDGGAKLVRGPPARLTQKPARWCSCPA